MYEDLPNMMSKKKILKLKRHCILILSLMIALFFVFLRPEPAYNKQYPDCARCHKLKFQGITLHPVIKTGGCVACHTTPHERGTKPKKFLFATGTDLCWGCHDKSKFTKKIGHLPVAKGECKSCHDVHATDAPGLLLSKMPDLCFNCHDANKITNKISHPPVAEGKCTLCHDPHSSNAAKLLLSDTPQLCFGCHEKNRYMSEKKKMHHAPVGAGKCMNCHDPHASPAEKLLVNAVPDLCFNCHAKDGFGGKNSHSPVVKGGLCLNCHEPHQADAGKLLFAEPSDFCFKCHDAKGFKGLTPHQPVTEGRCPDCHDPHSSDYQAQLVRPMPDLCFGCHSSPVKDTKGIELPSIKKLFDDKETRLHKPVADGLCTGCHSPHPNDNYRLLKGTYPREFYAPFSEKAYGLCFICHTDPKAFTEARTLTSTKFRNGNLNLHYRHVTREKGRTCSICHNYHGAKFPKLIRESFIFGKKTLQMTFKETVTGGSCTTACHKIALYDRYDPVFNVIKTTPAPGADASEEELMMSKEKDFPEQKALPGEKDAGDSPREEKK